jgi:CBS domain-containing protein
MTTVKQLLEFKGHDIVSIEPDRTVYEAIERLAERRIGALLVIENNKLVGLFSERDYARKVVLKGKSSKDTPVRDVMTLDLICVKPEASVDECMTLMTEERVRHLPVLDKGELVGIVSIGDAIRQIISERDFTIRQLEQYIASG